MATAISKLAVLLTANTAGFTSGLKGAVAPLKSFGSSVTSIGSKVVAFGGALTALAAGAGMAALVKGQMESIDSTAKLSDRLGIATEKLTGLQHAADLSGVSNEQLTGGFEKLLKSLGEAAQGGGQAGAALAKMGLDAKQLVDADPDQAFIAISEGLKNINNPAERATTAMEVFGKSGQSLLPLMLSGKEGITAAMEEAEKLGLTFSRVDAAKVEAANDAMTRLQAVFVGVARTLAIQLSPFIDAAASKLTDLASSGDGMGKMVVNAFEWVVTGIAKAADFIGLLKAGFYTLKGVASLALLGIAAPLNLVIQGVEWLGKKLGVLGDDSTWGAFSQGLQDGLVDEADKAFKQAGESWNEFVSGKHSAAAAQMFDGIRAKAQQNAQAVADNAAKMRGAAAATEDWAAKLKLAEQNAQKVTDTIAGLQKEVAQFGKSDADKKLADLAALGATPEQLSQAKKSLDQLDALNAAKKKSEELQDRAKSVLESIQTPTQKYDEQIGSLSELLNNGLLSWDQYGAAVRKAREELEKSGNVDPAKAPDAPELIRAGSAAALKLAFDGSRGVQRVSREKTDEKALAEAQETNRQLRELVRNSRPSDADATETLSI
jgi:hypothetical protein